MLDPKLPLIDIHRHLDGNIRPATIWQLAQQHQIKLPVSTFKEFIPYVQIQHSEADLLAFLAKLDWGVAVLKTVQECRRIAYENVEDAYNAGIDYAELRFSPYYMAMTHQLNLNEVVAAVIAGVAQGEQEFDIKINLIGILSRTFGVEKCQAELNALLDYKQHLVAIDLAGDELHFPGELFVSHFEQVRKAGLQVTIHAGEAAGSTSIWQAIKQLGATRIGHGVASIKDQALMDYMREQHITIESCLTSNFQTGTVANIAEHPVKQFLALGLNVCLNTDDPAVEGIELQHEFQLAVDVLGLNAQQISQLQQNALSASFLSEQEKNALRTKPQMNHVKNPLKR
jgi:adenosine deaminase